MGELVKLVELELVGVRDEAGENSLCESLGKLMIGALAGDGQNSRYAKKSRELSLFRGGAFITEWISHRCCNCTFTDS